MFHYLSLVFAGILLVVCAGCSDNEGKTDKIVLHFWHIMNYSGPREILEDAVARFESAHPGVTVEVDTFSNDDYKTKLALEMASGNDPDVFFNWGAGGQTGQYISQGRLMDLTDWAEKRALNRRLLDTAMEFCRKDGRLYCVPLDLSVVVLWCNSRMFKDAGLAYPKTWEELLAVCDALKARGVTPLALGNYDAWPGSFYFCYLANRLGGTQLFVDAAAGKNGRTLADGAFVAAGDMLQELVRRGAFNVDFAERREDEARKLFVRGKSAMYLGGSWLVGQIVKDPENAEFLKGLVPVAFPALADGRGDASAMLTGVNCGFAVSEKCAHKELALELLETLVDETTCAEWCRIGRIPACDIKTEWAETLPRPTQEACAMLKAARELQPYYDQYLQAAVTVAHKNTVKDLFAGRTTGRKAADIMAARQAECARQ